jgi:hypothetical protein
MQRRVASSLVFLTMLLFAESAYCASTWYVAATGSDTSPGNGSITYPWKTITKAVSSAAAGDTIYVRGGTHTYTSKISISKSGTSAAWYYLLAYPTDSPRPTLDFSSMSDSDSNRGIELSGSYWYFKGLDIKGAGDNGMYMSGSNNIIEFCSFYENRDSGLQLAGGAANNQIINCDSYYNCDSGYGNADGFSPKMNVGSGNYFYGCRSWQNSDDAYDGYLRGADDVTTTYENCWAFRAGYLKDGTQCSGNGNGFKMGGCDADANGLKLIRHNAILKNCLSFNNKAKGFDQNSDKGSMWLYNCTSFGNGGANYSITSGPLREGKTAIVTNGISLTGTVSLGSFVSQTTDSWLTGFSCTSADFVSVDPTAAYGARNADGSLPDITFMHLAAGSNLINSGTDVDLPYLGTAPDLGCFEYVDNGDVTAPLPNPMTFLTAPYALDATSVTMVAATANDVSGVQYLFHCTAGGGHDSAWQDSATYTDTGLSVNTTYSYQVKARDKSASHNETAYSAEASVTTTVVADTTAPTPNPMTWATAPSATGTDTIVMTATTATDNSGVEYFFANITDPNHNSAWQASPVYTDTGLLNNTTYAYRVIARDKSASLNETGWSNEAGATTIRFTCSASITGDLNSDCLVNFMDYAAMATAWGATATPSQMVTNGTFDAGITPWTVVNVSTATGTMTGVFDGTVGNPAGSALVTAVNGTTGANNHRFYQVFPVTQGKQYTLTGQWSGNIVGLVTNATGGSLRNWAEVFVSFETSTTPSNWTATSALMYKKAYGAGTTNTSTGIWTWEAFTGSPNGSNPPSGGIFTATGPYMVVAFNLGGRANSGSPHINVDNISVVESVPCATIDLNADCVLNWQDMTIFTTNWLACNRYPTGECGQ